MIKKKEIRFMCKCNRYKNKEFKGKIKPCYGKILLNLNNNRYTLINTYSKFCDKLIEENHLEDKNNFILETEIINYNIFKDKAISYLNKHPLINRKNFKLFIEELYSNSVCNFELKPYFFVNIYKTWKSTSNIFSKV